MGGEYAHPQAAQPHPPASAYNMPCCMDDASIYNLCSLVLRSQTNDSRSISGAATRFATAVNQPRSTDTHTPAIVHG